MIKGIKRFGQIGEDSTDWITSIQSFLNPDGGTDAGAKRSPLPVFPL